MTKQCVSCNKVLEVFNFHKKSAAADGLASYCKSCTKEYGRQWTAKNRDKARANHKKYKAANRAYYTALESQRRARKFSQVSKVFRSEVIEIYKNCPDDKVVDHIIPLKGKQVSGLHVPWNLQYLTPSENAVKSNKVYKCQTY